MWLFLLFVAVPIIEIALFIQIGDVIGLFPTLAIVIVTALLGTFLVRSQGLQAMGQIRTNLNELRDPTEALAHGAMILAAGLLLLTPGFFTDAVGFSLLVPPVRTALFGFIKARVKVQSFVQTDMHQDRRGPQSFDDGETIDGEFQDLDANAPKPTHRPSSGWTRH